MRSSRVPVEDDGILRPSPAQLRQLWEYDNQCASKYMGAPIRACTSQEASDEPDLPSLSKEEMNLVLADIKNMWRRLSLVWEVFSYKEDAALGYRLRVKEDLPIKLSMKENDFVTVGWKAKIPEGCSSLHLYLRSDLEDQFQYLGGPVSYCNWCPKRDTTIKVRQTSHGSGRHQVRAETRHALKPGTELLWDYNIKKMPDFDSDNWFRPDCCSIIPRTHTAKKKDEEEKFQELCVLCGRSYRLNSKTSGDRKAQKKVHLLNSHADYLGSNWDGLGEFDCQKYKVDYNKALLEAERLNRLLQRLHSNAWKVVPACTVMSKREMTGDSDEVVNTFRRHCARLKRLGCVVLRGRSVPTSAEYLKSVIPSRWDEIFAEPSSKPRRVYAMAERDRIAWEEQLKDWMLQDLMMVMNMHHYDAGLSAEDASDDSDTDA